MLLDFKSGFKKFFFSKPLKFINKYADNRVMTNYDDEEPWADCPRGCCDGGEEEYEYTSVPKWAEEQYAEGVKKVKKKKLYKNEIKALKKELKKTKNALEEESNRKYGSIERLRAEKQIESLEEKVEEANKQIKNLERQIRIEKRAAKNYFNTVLFLKNKYES